jgi:uncharacterized protein YqeY
MEQTLKKTIEDAARSAMKSREELTLSVLRLLMTAIHNREIEKKTKAGGVGDLTDDEVMAVIRSEAKKRKDAVAEYTRGGRAAAADKEAAELAILEKYLPRELADAEIEKLLLPLTKGASAADFGRVMGAAMKAIAGRASGDRVGVIVRRLLGGAS